MSSLLISFFLHQTGGFYLHLNNTILTLVMFRGWSIQPSHETCWGTSTKDTFCRPRCKNCFSKQPYVSVICQDKSAWGGKGEERVKDILAKDRLKLTYKHLYNLAISFYKHLSKHIFTNTYIFPNTLESSLTFMYPCSGLQWGLHWLAANSQGLCTCNLPWEERSRYRMKLSGPLQDNVSFSSF